MMAHSDSVEAKISEKDVISATMAQITHFTLIVHPNETTISRIYEKGLERYLPSFGVDFSHEGHKKKVTPPSISYYFIESQTENYLPPRLHIAYRRGNLSSFEDVLHQVEKDIPIHPKPLQAFMAFNYLSIEEVFSLPTYPKTNVLDYSYALGRTLKKVGLERLRQIYSSAVKYYGAYIAEIDGHKQSKQHMAYNRLVNAQLFKTFERIEATASALDELLTGVTITPAYSLFERNYSDEVLNLFEDFKRDFNPNVERELIRLGYLVKDPFGRKKKPQQNKGMRKLKIRGKTPINRVSGNLLSPHLELY